MVSLSKPGLAHPPNHKTDFVLDVILQRVNPNLYHSKCYQLDPKKKNLLRRRKNSWIWKFKKKKKFIKNSWNWMSLVFTLISSSSITSYTSKVSKSLVAVTLRILGNLWHKNMEIWIKHFWTVTSWSACNKLQNTSIGRKRE